MRAAIVTAPGRLELTEVPVPVPAAGECLLRVEACGLCHSDLHAIDGDWAPPPALPLIPGHEVVGIVAGVGAGLSPALVGRRYGVAWHAGSCGTCSWCRSGFETVCPEAEMTGYTRNGGFADFLTARVDHAVELPGPVDPVAAAPILCAGVTTYRGLHRGGVEAGDWVLVSGVGGLGHLAVQYALARGARVIAVDPSQDRLALASGLGAECVLSSDNPDLVRLVSERTGGGPQAVLVTATAPAAFEAAIEMVRPGGAVVFVGLPPADRDRIRVSISAMSNWEKSIVGSNVGSRTDLRAAVDLFVGGAVHAHVSSVSFAQLPQALSALRRGEVSGRLVLDMREPGA
jgi:propanol-preferring alcohol dehydrogenase